MAPDRSPRAGGFGLPGMRNSALATAALTSVAVLSQTADAAPAAEVERPSREDVSQRVSSLYDRAESDTGQFNLTRTQSTGARGRGAAAGGSGGEGRSRSSDPDLDNIARQWFGAARASLGPTIPAILPADRTPDAGARPARAARRPAEREGERARGGRELEAAGRASALELPAGGTRQPVAELTAGPVAELTAGPVAGLTAGPVAELTAGSTPESAASPTAVLPAVPQQRQGSVSALTIPAAEPKQSTLRQSKQRSQRKIAAASDLLYRYTARQTAAPRAAIAPQPTQTVPQPAAALEAPQTQVDWMPTVAAQPAQPSWQTPAAGIHSDQAAWQTPANGTPSAQASWQTSGNTAQATETSWQPSGTAAQAAQPSWQAPGAEAQTPQTGWQTPSVGAQSTQAGWQPAGALAAQPSQTPWQTPVTESQPAQASWQAAAAAAVSQAQPTQAGWQTGAVEAQPSQTGWQTGATETQPSQTGWQTGALAAQPVQLGWQGSAEEARRAAEEAWRMQQPSVLDTGVPAVEDWRALQPSVLDTGVPAVETSTGTKADRAIAFARAQIGRPCLWGAVGPESYDNAGLTQAAWKAAGVSLPRSTQDQASAGTVVPLAESRPGDLIFFHDNFSHVGIYTGNGLMIHAPGPGSVIREESIHNAGEAAIRITVRPV
ncbi:C40 family peptidase [Streptomyces cylindrosporus]|uniref:C40 family peptidase n=1 Tax=Streptomyces cylindrosporus TaxID=2927583 RepID=UPI0027E37B6B|nr:NlpC/P60 family protein [Streptomyces cylindrosporus]